MKPEEILTAAADKLEKMLTGVTPGEWYSDWDRGVYAYGEPGDPGPFPDVVKGGEMSLEDTTWVALLGPAIGPDLIAHLRAAANFGACCMLDCPEHVALVKLAMQLVGLYGKPDSPHWDRGVAEMRASAERSDPSKSVLDHPAGDSAEERSDDQSKIGS